jgi:aspartate aminotransferase
MADTAPAANIKGQERAPAPPRERVFSNMAEGLRGSEILRIAGEIRELKATGQPICDLTVGDFSPAEFPIPDALKAAIHEALERGETNYPPSNGLPELKQAVADLYRRTFSLDVAPESVLITSGTRPGIYGGYRVVCDPGDRVVYAVPSWNNNHYTHLVGGSGVPIVCGPQDRFLPSREAVRSALPGARLLCLCSPLNPAGTVIARDVLAGICEDIVRENDARRRRGERPLFLLYDQVYWTLTFGRARHLTPLELVPEIAPHCVLVDGISKAFAATGLRVGWVVGSRDVIAKMASLLGHVGAWAPRPEQSATIALLRDQAALDQWSGEFKPKVQARLERLRRGFAKLKQDGFAVDSFEPEGAIYLSARIAPFGRRTPDGSVLRSNDDVRRYVLSAAGFAVVPFQAFGSTEEDGWFRLSVGAVSERDIDAALPRVESALRALA